jgi:hypothetical protein
MNGQSGQETIFIGDIHGQAATLLALLETLGWKQRNGVLRGPGHAQLVFVGDLIDRGPRSRQTIDIVRELIEHDNARCVLGNHEYNAVQYNTPDPERPGQYLREHSDKNFAQHEAFLEEFANDPAGLKDTLAWFCTLPVAIEGQGWRCVHACWDDQKIAILSAHNDAWYLSKERWTAAARPGEPEYRAIEILTKGPEWKLPYDASFLDKGNHKRTEARVRWWQPNPATFREALRIPTTPEGLDLDEQFPKRLDGYDPDAPPVFFGHYWLSGEVLPERPNAACIDYSAGKGDRLVAYRHRGEQQLLTDRFFEQSVI